MIEFLNSSGLWAVVGPVGGILVIVAVLEAVISKRKRSSLLWVKRPVTVALPSDNTVADHVEAVEEIVDDAEEAGPHGEAVAVDDVTDEEIDGWARGD